MLNLLELDALTKEYADERLRLKAKMDELEGEIRQLKKRYLPGVKRAAERTAEKKGLLQAAIEESAELFVRPRTYILYGVKVGFQKQKGEISYADEAQTLRLIHKHFPDMAEVLIKTTEKPVKTALAGLPAAELKKLGVTVTADGDGVVIKATDSEIDKLVEALLKDEESEKVMEAA